MIRNEYARYLLSGMDAHGGDIKGGTERLAYTMAESAEALRISLRTIKTLVADGRLPSVKIGRRRLIPVAALHQLLDVMNQEDGS